MPSLLISIRFWPLPLIKVISLAFGYCSQLPPTKRIAFDCLCSISRVVPIFLWFGKVEPFNLSFVPTGRRLKSDNVVMVLVNVFMVL